MSTLEAKLVGLFLLFPPIFRSDLVLTVARIRKQLPQDCKPTKVEDPDGHNFVKVERVDEVMPQVEDEAEKFYRMLDVTKAGVVEYPPIHSILMNKFSRSSLLLSLSIMNQLQLNQNVRM